ncbi:unnamed protein product [Lota lota]
MAIWRGLSPPAPRPLPSRSNVAVDKPIKKVDRLLNALLSHRRSNAPTPAEPAHRDMGPIRQTRQTAPNMTVATESDGMTDWGYEMQGSESQVRDEDEDHDGDDEMSR